MRSSFGGAEHWPAYCACPDRACSPGAAGGIGQPLALLLKLSPRVHTLHLYDVVNTAGVKADISHINTTARVRGTEVATQEGARCGPPDSNSTSVQVRAFTGPAQLADALSGCDLVVIPAGVPRKPGMTVRLMSLADATPLPRLTPMMPASGSETTCSTSTPASSSPSARCVTADLPRTGPIGRRLKALLCSQVIVKACPCAIVNIISNPVNSTVPIAAETFKKFGVYDARRLFGALEPGHVSHSFNACTHPARAQGSLT